jgi:hypothetical protein
MSNKFLIMGVVLTLASCTTPEFREERGICEATWMKKIPPHYVQEMYNRTESRQVPTGETYCTTHGYGYTLYTTCEQVMKTEFYTVPAVRTVDRNERRRNSFINSCVQTKCIQKYGNFECKT